MSYPCPSGLCIRIRIIRYFRYHSEVDEVNTTLCEGGTWDQSERVELGSRMHRHQEVAYMSTSVGRL